MKDTRYFYIGVVNGKGIVSNSFVNLKRNASRVANKDCNVIDTLDVTCTSPEYNWQRTFTRMNRKSCNGVIVRGAWG